MADDLLRRAVDRLRASVEGLRSIQRDPWAAGTGHVYTTTRGWWLANGLGTELAHHIALTASPHVIDAQIAWLEAILAESASLAEHDGFDPWVTIAGYAEAVAYARAVLREQT